MLFFFEKNKVIIFKNEVYTFYKIKIILYKTCINIIKSIKLKDIKVLSDSYYVIVCFF